MKHKVLFVDDSMKLLSAIKRRLRRDLDLTLAEGGHEALDILQKDGPFAVVVTDQNMPGMDGITLLKKVGRISPQTIRIMLTGQTDQETTLEAINDSHIFALLNKPCTPEDLLDVVQKGLDAFDDQSSERNLMEQTLAGTIKLLLDIVGLQSTSLTHVPSYARQWARRLADGLEDIKAWELELALMLAPLGRTTLPPDIQAKISAGQTDFDPSEQALIDQCPKAARDLLAHIPHLDAVAEALYYQNTGFDGVGFPGDGKKGRDLSDLSRLVFLLNRLIEACENQHGPASLMKAFSTLTRNSHQFDPDLFEQCKTILLDAEKTDSEDTVLTAIEVGVTDLMDGDLLNTDIRTVHDSLVVKRGIVVTPPLIQKIINVNNRNGIAMPFTVLRRTVASAA